MIQWLLDLYANEWRSFLAIFRDDDLADEGLDREYDFTPYTEDAA